MPIALIVGASRGLGRALAQEHLKRGWEVIATVRESRSLADLSDVNLSVETLDITDWATVDGFGERLGDRRLDLLFVNAGLLLDRDTPIGGVDPDAFARLMLTNAYAPLRLIEALDRWTKPDATVAVMSSGLGSVARNTSGGWEAYRMSKAALNIGLKSLEARDRASRTWLVATPGWVQTEMGGEGAPLTIGQSIPSLVDMLEARRETGGVRYVDYKNDEMAW
jgi:NAD(P)-dependent dehydrogenase (short-subunit alcohol dehydrogenase family)